MLNRNVLDFTLGMCGVWTVWSFHNLLQGSLYTLSCIGLFTKLYTLSYTRHFTPYPTRAHYTLSYRGLHINSPAGGLLHPILQERITHSTTGSCLHILLHEALYTLSYRGALHTILQGALYTFSCRGPFTHSSIWAPYTLSYRELFTHSPAGGLLSILLYEPLTHSCRWHFHTLLQATLYTLSYYTGSPLQQLTRKYLISMINIFRKQEDSQWNYIFQINLHIVKHFWVEYSNANFLSE